MPSYDSTLEEIKSRIDIVDFISQYVTLKRVGQNFKALCPFHSEKTPSFIVSPAKQIYHCFGCGEGGDIFTFLVKHEGMTYKEAIRELAHRAGVELKWRKGNVHEDEKRRLLALHRDALLFFQNALKKNPKAMDYLRERGISRDAQEIFSIGFAPKSWNSLMSYLKAKGYKEDMMAKAGLVNRGEKGFYDVFRNRVIFPIFDLRGDVVAFGGRALDDSMPKYLNSPETPLFNKSRTLYGLNLAREAIKKTGYVLLMEGYLDVITAHIHGVKNSIAPLGTAFTEDHGRLIKRFTDHAILVFDSDQAGVMAAKKAVSVLFSAGVDVKMLSLPAGDDPDSFLRNNGADAFKSLLERPVSIIDFLVQYGGDRRVIARDAIEVLMKIPDGLLQGSYVKLLSERLGINEFFLIEELKRMMRRDRKKDVGDTPDSSYPQRPRDEMYVIRLLLQLPERIRDVLERISDDYFSDDVLRSIFSKIRQGITESERLLLECDEDEKRVLAKIMLMEEDFEEPEKGLEDCLRQMIEKRHETMLKEIESQIRDAEQRGEMDRVELLQRKHMQIKQNTILKDRRI
jgi:DNA primase